MAASSIRIFLLVAVLLVGLRPRSAGAEPRDRAGGARILVNGHAIGQGVAPTTVGSTVLVPLRFVSQALGAAVRWDPEKQTATIKGFGRTVTARAGDPVVRAGDQTIIAETPPRVLDGRMMVPLRVINQALGASVTWDQRTKTVAIRTPRPVQAASIPPPPRGQKREGAAGGPLMITLRTDKKEYRAGEPVQLTLEARNTSGAPVTLQMSSGQKYDFEVARGDTVVWKWSDDRMFTQALVDMTVAPNQTLVYRETWNQRSREGRAVEPGEYTLTGYLTTRNLSLPKARVTIRILGAGS
jgi:intracellular proteinase inhibitor BsuPI/copper amine oxidase-like protein